MTAQVLHSRSRRVMRRLLQADKPAPTRTEADIEAEQERNFNWNFTVNFLDGAFFWLGLSFMSYTTILPLYVSKITESPLPIAILAVIGSASWYLPQLLTAGPTEKLARKMPIVVNVGFFAERLPLWLMPVAALMSIQYPIAALLLFFLGYAWHGLGAGMVAPAWSDLVARCFPVNRRARFFGITAFVGTGLGTLGALASGWILSNYAYPYNFAAVFFLAALFVTLSWIAIALTREPVEAVPKEIMERKGSSWSRFRSIIQGDRNFRHYLIVRLLTSMGNMAAGFVTVSAIQRWSVADGTVGLYTAALLIGQTTGNLLAGFIADRYGHKISLVIGLVGIVAAYLLALVAPSAIWYYVVFFILGVATGIGIVSGVLINLEFSRPEYRPSYVGIANTTMGIGSVIGPLLGGLIALQGYNLLFAVSALFGAASLVLLITTVQEPRQQTSFYDPVAVSDA